MTRTVFFYFLLSLGLFLSACEKDIQLDIPDQNKLVVFSNFTPDNLFRLYLSTSTPIGQTVDNDSKFPASANIQLFEDGTYIDDLMFQSSLYPDFEAPYYYLNLQPKIGSEYSFIATLADYPEVTSKNTVPERIPIDDLEVISVLFKSDVNNPEISSYSLQARLKIARQISDPKYFHILAYRDKVECDPFDPNIKYYYREPVNFRLPNRVDHLEILHESGILFDQKAFNENPDGIEVNFSFDFDTALELKTPVQVELRHVSKDYYLFHKSVGEQEYSNLRESLLSTESVLIHNNIEHGLGNFSGYAVAVDSLTW